jgi:hypothetical protein
MHDNSLPMSAREDKGISRWLAAATTGSATLRAGEPHQQQQDEGADDRSDDPHRAEAVDVDLVILDQVLQEAADERADDAEDDGSQEADGVAAGKKQAGDQSSDQPDDDQDDDECKIAVLFSSMRILCMIRPTVTIRN